MKKKYIVLSLVVLTILGALFTALGSNMFFSDIGNLGAGITKSAFFVTLAPAMVAVTCAMGILYVIRIYKNPGCHKRISRLYFLLSAIFNGLGLIGVILSSALFYGSFISPNPFPGFAIIFTILEVTLTGGSIACLVLLKKCKEDDSRVKIDFLYVLKTIGWFLFIMLVLNRFGMFLGSPFYIYWRNFYKTFPFYIYLLVPLYLGVSNVLFKLDFINKKNLLIMACAGAGATLILSAYVILAGMNDTLFISSLSPAMPLERLAAMPVETIIHVLSYLGVSAALLITSLKKEKTE